MPVALPDQNPKQHEIEAWYINRICRHGSKPITYGWQFSALVVLPEQPSSWKSPLDQQRIESAQTALGVAGEQLRRLLPLLSRRPILVGDRAYSAARFLVQVAELNCDLLVRAKRNQVFYWRLDYEQVAELFSHWNKSSDVSVYEGKK